MSGLPVADELSLLLRGSGLRVTRPRLAVLQTLAAHPHATVEEIATGVRTEITAVSTQAVYHILGTFTEKGILRRMEPAGSAARYELSPKDNHQHLVCRGCGQIQDVVLTGQLPAATVTDAHGYLIHQAEVTIWGTCPSCQRNHRNEE